LFKPVFFIQLCLVAVCVVALIELLNNFPAPSPLIKPFLPPKVRWPAEQVERWIETQNVDRGFLRFFARDPERNVSAGDNLVSPSDGVVQAVSFRSNITFLVVSLSFWDVHVVRAPTAGVVRTTDLEGTYYPKNSHGGDYGEAFYLRGKVAPVQQVITIQTTKGPVLVRLITSYWASRLKVWVHTGEHLTKGQRLGRILLGSTVVLELPGRARFSVKPGDRLVGGESIVCSGSCY
jgi:phosphatidylserine decarboxylase